ncbi:hypothetical protein BaRGS_00037709 [Batillaria attramentaria]|uniref:MAM domain-containing protein n=1 Tax=Batillaria attramentaria TaxID=370345 RepID=A0ABD0J8B7_9CAEN
MYGQIVGSKARLLSTVLCSTGKESYQLGFHHFIDCRTDVCKLSVILQENGDSEKSLWQRTIYRFNWQANILTENIHPQSGMFRIIFDAERVGSNGYAGEIGVADITLKYVGEVPPAISPTSPAAPATTQTTVKPSTPTTVSEQTTKQEITTQTELSSTSTTRTHVSICCGTSQQTSPTGAAVKLAANSEDTALGVSHAQEQRDAAFAENLPDSATYDQLRPPEERTDNRQYETLQVSGLQTTVASQAESPYQNTAGNKEYVNLQANEATRTQTLSEGRESENQYESLGLSSPPSDYTSLRLH